MDGNLAILTRPSDALLNTDTTPACVSTAGCINDSFLASSRQLCLAFH
jgi:hypothetical protein